VQCRPTDSGLLFRYGDSILPIRGISASSWSRVIHSRLEHFDEPLRREPVHTADDEIHNRLYSALKSADMLYERLDDDPDEISNALRARFRAEIARLEATTNRPLTLFTTVRMRPLLILASIDLVCSIAEAAIESGMANIGLCVPQFPKRLTDAIAHLHSRYDDEIPNLRLTAVSTPGAGPQNREADLWHYIVAAGVTDEDWTSVDNLLDKQIGATSTTVLALCAGTQRVVTGPIDARPGSTCTTCIRRYCSSPDSQCAFGLPAARMVDLQIGSRLLFQQLWDIASEIPGAMIEDTILDFDIQSCNLERRPRPRNANCPRCASVPRLTEHRFTDSWDETAQVSLRELCRRAERAYADEKTGMIAAVDGVDLLQYPFAKCAAQISDRWKPEGASGWCVESGEDLVAARWHAVCRAIEVSYEEIMCARARAGQTIPVFSCLNEFLGDEIPSRGHVASASRWDALKAEAFYRSVARYMNIAGDWHALQWMDRPPISSVELGYAYLADLNETEAIAIEECRLGCTTIRGLRFRRGNETYSVIAGPDSGPLWLPGIQDICIALDGSSSPDTGAPEIRTRFRAVHPGDPASLEFQIRELRESAALEFRWTPLHDPEMTKRLPLYLAYASLFQQ